MITAAPFTHATPSTPPAAPGIFRGAMSIGMSCSRESSCYSVKPRHRSSRARHAPRGCAAFAKPVVPPPDSVGAWLARDGVRPYNTKTRIHRQKKPRSSRDRIGVEGTVEEPLREGDQTVEEPAESSVPTLPSRKLAENDLFIGIAAIATNRPCRHPVPLRESNHDTVP
ncbi:hypothetical protein EMIT0P100_60161 [Pseudomonas sp. IT-P100]